MSGWISTKDRVPTDRRAVPIVLDVAHKDNRCRFVGMFDGATGWHAVDADLDSFDYRPFSCPVLYWYPLPDPPTGK